mmetsp:Transcript_6495/g.11955  ORF Transcript_6495/g.11955 Transcript_6495/m.11955 type:complete len:115 (+) Transcript_6495:1060-1404(+)
MAQQHSGSFCSGAGLFVAIEGPRGRANHAENGVRPMRVQEDVDAVPVEEREEEQVAEPREAAGGIGAVLQSVEDRWGQAIEDVLGDLAGGNCGGRQRLVEVLQQVDLALAERRG